MKNKVFFSELQTILKARCEHAAPSEKWLYTQALRKLENFVTQRDLSTYITEQAKCEGFDRSDLQEKIISEYLLPSVPGLTAAQKFDPIPTLFQPAPRQLSNLVLKRMVGGVPGFTVNDVAFDQKMSADEVDQQLRGYVDQKAVERADEVASGAVRKLRFEQSIERVPEVFFDLSPYHNRLTGGDCAIIAVAVAENKNYSAAVAATSDIAQEGGGIRTIDLKSYLDGKGYAHTPLKGRHTLEDLWHSDFIAVGDAGVIMVAGEGDGVASHAVGFREGRMHVADPILTSQLYASAEVVGVFFHKTSDTAAIARLVGNQATHAPVAIHERALTEVELEALQVALVNEVMASLAAHWNVVPISEGV